MGSTRSTLASIEGHLLESVGQRASDRPSRLSPVPAAKDIGRRPLNGFGSIAINQVIPDPQQPRAEFSTEAIDQLAASIREKGQLAPIRVRWLEDAGKWIIIAGERRWRAAKQAGLASIECHFHEGELSRSEVLEQQMIENLLREDLKPIEEARAFAALMELNSWNGKQVADALRIPASTVSRGLALLKLPEDVQRQVDSGDVPARSAYELSKLPDQQQQRQLASQAAQGRLTHDEAARAVKKFGGNRDRKPRGTKLTFFAERDWKIVVASDQRATYHDIELALQQVLEEVRHRIENNVQLF